MSWMLQEVCHEGKLNIQAPIWFHFGTREPKNMLIKECFFELCSWWLIHVQMYMLLVENAKDPLQCQSYMYTTRYKATESELCSIVCFGHETVFKHIVPRRVKTKRHHPLLQIIYELVCVCVCVCVCVLNSAGSCYIKLSEELSITLPSCIYTLFCRTPNCLCILLCSFRVCIIWLTYTFEMSLSSFRFGYSVLTSTLLSSLFRAYPSNDINLRFVCILLSTFRRFIVWHTFPRCYCRKLIGILNIHVLVRSGEN